MGQNGESGSNPEHNGEILHPFGVTCSFMTLTYPPLHPELHFQGSRAHPVDLNLALINSDSIYSRARLQWQATFGAVDSAGVRHYLTGPMVGPLYSRRREIS